MRAVRSHIGAKAVRGPEENSKNIWKFSTTVDACKWELDYMRSHLSTFSPHLGFSDSDTLKSLIESVSNGMQIGEYDCSRNAIESIINQKNFVEQLQIARGLAGSDLFEQLGTRVEEMNVNIREAKHAYTYSYTNEP